MWTKKKLNLKQIKLFGCDVFAKTLGPLRKLDERSKKYKMIGYTTNGYKLWDEGRQKVIVARDVIFREKIETKKEKEDSTKVKITIKKEEEYNEDEQISKEREDEPERSEDEDPIYEETIEDVEGEENENTENQPRCSLRVKNFPDRYNDYVFLTYKQAVQVQTNKNGK